MQPESFAEHVDGHARAIHSEVAIPKDFATLGVVVPGACQDDGTANHSNQGQNCSSNARPDPQHTLRQVRSFGLDLPDVCIALQFHPAQSHAKRTKPNEREADNLNLLSVSKNAYADLPQIVDAFVRYKGWRKYGDVELHRCRPSMQLSSIPTRRSPQIDLVTQYHTGRAYYYHAVPSCAGRCIRFANTSAFRLTASLSISRRHSYSSWFEPEMLSTTASFCTHVNESRDRDQTDDCTLTDTRYRIER